MSQLALVMFAVNALAALFSLVGVWALYNIPSVPSWDYSAITFWLGITNTITGILTAFLVMAYREGWRYAVLLLMLCTLIAGGMELLGTTTGVPFGAYSYTDMMGPKFLGHVPYLIPPSWMMMLYPSMVITEAMRVRRWLKPVVAGVILTIWDFAMDPAMTAGFAYWQWHSATGFYGMPYVNWLGWWLTGAIVAGCYWMIDRRWKGHWDNIAVALYLVQGGFMAILSWVYMRPLAAVLWGISVMTVLVIVWRRGFPSMLSEVSKW
ncbi:MAG: hypothetical protein C4335_11455 [Armatimonadota bacterium]